MINLVTTSADNGVGIVKNGFVRERRARHADHIAYPSKDSRIIAGKNAIKTSAAYRCPLYVRVNEIVMSSSDCGIGRIKANTIARTSADT